MSFFTGIKRAFGFGAADPDEPLFADTTAQEPAEQAAPSPAVASHPLQPVEFDQIKIDRIFEHVVKTFNESLPGFLASSVDADSQRRVLYDTLSADIRTYLDSLATAAEAYCEARWKARQADMTSELEAIRHKADDVEKKSAEIQQKQLSADRQKRALTERVHDLESQLSRLEAEREQFELENRSLINRLKVAGVQNADIEKLQEDLTALRAENLQLKNNPEAASAAEINALKEQIDQMTQGIDSLKETNRVSNEMQADLRRRLAEKDTEIAELNELIKEFGQISAQLEDVEKVMTAKDEKIANLESGAAKKDKEIASLRKTIAENIALQAEREKAFKEELESLRPPTIVNEMMVEFGEPAEEAAPVITEDDLSAMEATFDNGDWFTKQPPAQTPSMRKPDSEADFGYQAPQKKKTHSPNPSQLSLF